MEILMLYHVKKEDYLQWLLKYRKTPKDFVKTGETIQSKMVDELEEKGGHTKNILSVKKVNEATSIYLLWDLLPCNKV